MPENLLFVPIALFPLPPVLVLLIFLSLSLKLHKVVHILRAEIIPLKCALIEVEAPYFGHFPLCIYQLFGELVLVQVLEDWVQVSYRMVVVFLLVEDATDVINSQGTFLEIFISG